MTPPRLPCFPAESPLEMDTLQSLEFILIIPLSFLLIATQFPHLFPSLTKQHQPQQSQQQQHILTTQSAVNTNISLSRNMISAIKLWSYLLFIFFFILTCCESRMTPLISFMIITLIISSFFIEHEIAQLLFHIVSSCSWIGCFDLYFRTSFEGEEFFQFFDMQCVVAVFLTTSIAMRAHLAQKWQFYSVPHMFVGIPLLCLYYWGLEMPICSLTQTSFFSCELMRSPPSLLRDTELSSYYRVFGVLSIILVHVVYGLIMRSFLPEEEEENATTASSDGSENVPVTVSSDSCRKKRTISGVESQREVVSSDRSVSTVPVPTSSGATDHPVQKKEASHRRSPPQVDENSGERKTASPLSTVPTGASSYSSRDISNYTSDFLLRLPSILEDSISASFWSSFTSFQPNLLHPHLQHHSTSSYQPGDRIPTKEAAHHKRCSHHHHVPSQSQRILRNPISHLNPSLDDENPDDVSSSRSRPFCARPVLDLHSYVPVPLPAPHVETPQIRLSSHSCPPSHIALGTSTGVGSISEEEAFEFVQESLHSCKTKRAN